MIGVYFSGTGNTKYCVETFLRGCDPAAATVSIEAADAVQKIRIHDELVLGYPVQFSNIPKILRDFVAGNACIWENKKVFILATMGLFSGDGAGNLARLLTRYGAIITGGLHLKMPDSIGDVKALKRPLAQNQALVRNAERKIERAVKDFQSGSPPQEGLGALSHLAGLLGQRLYFRRKTKAYSDDLKIDRSRCLRCGGCVPICPMKNLALEGNRVIPRGKCTMCYRCVNACPAQAITLLGKRVYEQCGIEKYL